MAGPGAAPNGTACAGRRNLLPRLSGPSGGGAAAGSGAGLSSSAWRRLAVLPAALLLGALALSSAQPAGAQLWSATLNVKQADGSGSSFGCNNDRTGAECSSASVLTDDDFAIASTEYSIERMTADSSTGALQVLFDRDVSDALDSYSLCVGSKALAFSSAAHGAGDRWAVWSAAGERWAAGDTVALQVAASCTQSSDATLSGLTVAGSTDGGTFERSVPIGTFAAATGRYRATVANAVTHVKLTPAVNESNASVRVGKAGALRTVAGGSESRAIALDEGANVIEVEVTAQDGTKKTYTVTLTRAYARVPLATAQDVCHGGNVGRSWVRSRQHIDHLVFCNGQNWRFVRTANAEGRCTETLPLFSGGTLRYCGSGANDGAEITGILSQLPLGSAAASCSASAFGAMHWRSTDVQDKVYYCDGGAWVALSLQVDPPDFAPSFGGATVNDRAYTVGTAIAPLVLPAAEGGDGTLSYALAPLPAGLEFTASTRTLSGTPETAGTYTLTYTATDADGSNADSDTLSFDIAVRVAPTPAVSLSVSPNPVTEGSSVTVTARLSAALTSDAIIPVTLSAGTAESGDYGPLASIFIAGGATSGTGTVTTAQDDDTANETFTVALGALPSGVAAGSPNAVTVTIDDDDDSSTPSVWSATLTVADLDGGGGYFGCENPWTPDGWSRPVRRDESARCSNPSVLTSDDFTHGGVGYTIRMMGTVKFNGFFEMRFNRDVSSALAGLKLCVGGGKSVAFSDANYAISGNWPRFGFPKFGWRAGNTVSLAIAPDCTGFTGGSGPGTTPAREPLTAAFEQVPAAHAGTGFTFLVRFSEPLGTAHPKAPRKASFEVSQGRAVNVKRVEAGLWRLRVAPRTWKRDVTVTLAGGRGCDAEGAVCAPDGRALGNTASTTVPGPARITVKGGRAREGKDASIDFAVTLSRAAAAPVTVDYATVEGTAAAGEDYTAASGTLTFAAGETAKTVAVAILDDAVDEGTETFTLRLANAVGARILDGRATGTIRNDDPIPQAWLARFGRAVTGQVLDAVEARLAAPRTAGAAASLAGQALPAWTASSLAAATDGGSSGGTFRTGATDRDAMEALGTWLALTGPDGGRGAPGIRGGEPRLEMHSRAIAGRDFLTGTSFALTGGSAQHGGFGALWGRGAIESFDGREGALALDGEVSTGLVGADWASAPGSASGAGRRSAGLAVGHSRGGGGYRSPAGGGEVEATLTGLYPYAGLDLTDRLSAWAAAGYGSGSVTVTPEDKAALKADLTMTMGAAGLRSEVLRPEDGDGLALALKADARYTRTSSDAVRSADGNMAASDAGVWLARAGVEGSRRFALGGDGGALTPSFEIGARRDGGDAEEGFGADLGGGLAFADPAAGLSLDLKARGLLAHEASGFREWGASAALAWDPRPETGTGVSLSLRQSWGASPAGGMDALLGRETLAGLAPDAGTGGDDRFHAASRLDGEIGYGLSAFGGAFTGTPNVGFGMSGGGARDYRAGWRLTPAAPGVAGFELNLDATRREAADGDAPPEHGATLRATIRW